MIASVAKVFETAISVTDERSRPASRQARAISCSTATSAFGECDVTSDKFSGVMTANTDVVLRGSLEFYGVRERLLEPFRLASPRGVGIAMSRVSFNRKRVKLKQLLGIRARLALLAVILVAPLMLERARSLEDARARQIAAATEEFSSLARHSANTE